MTQEDKDLLLKDLSARLRYGVKVHIETLPNTPHTLDEFILWVIRTKDDEIVKPYLRPLSSMTSSEKGWYDRLRSSTIAYAALIDWLNENHFDYRGLIEKGLAIEITKENNPYKE